MELQIRNVSKRYSKQLALNGFSATFGNGIYGILGPNGAGKTTLINIILGLTEATSGTVLLDSVNIKALGDQYFDKIGYLPQSPIFYRTFRAFEFLEYMCAVKGMNPRSAKARVVETLELVNLFDDRNKKIGAFSGGMRQRLGIAQAILNDPQILILDEPTSGLDPKERIRFRNIVSKLSKNKTVLLATHIVPDIEYIAKEILLMDKGQLINQGKVVNLLKTVEGKVWLVGVGEDEIDPLLEKYSVGNIKPTKNGYSLKVIADEKPFARAEASKATLEDVFLYHFGETGSI